MFISHLYFFQLKTNFIKAAINPIWFFIKYKITHLDILAHRKIKYVFSKYSLDLEITNEFIKLF